MPWNTSDVDRFNKGLTPHEKEVWVAIANRTLEDCQGSTQACESLAIRTANAAIRSSREKESFSAFHTIEAEEQGSWPSVLSRCLEGLHPSRPNGRPFGHPGSKTLMVKHILPLIPEDLNLYVEPFCGAATIYFALAHKERKPRAAVLSDLDDDLIFALNFVKSLTPQDLAYLQRQDWRSDKGRWKYLYAQHPLRARERFYRFLYLNVNSFADAPSKGYARRGTPMTREGILNSVQNGHEALQGNVRILKMDAHSTIRKFDSSGTFFYCDPPYPGSGDDAAFKNQIPTIEEISTWIRPIKGRWLLSLMDNEPSRKSFDGFTIYSIPIKMRHQIVGDKTGRSAKRYRRELLVCNYKVQKEAEPQVQTPVLSAFDKALKSLGVEIKKADESPQDPQASKAPKDPRDPQDPQASKDPIYLYGPFLIPNERDAQNHRVSRAEVTDAIRQIDLRSIAIDIEHQDPAPPQGVRITQIFQAPIDFAINGEDFVSGSGVIEVEVSDTDLKRRVQAHDIRGFSIFGHANIRQDGSLENIAIDKISLVKDPAIRDTFTVIPEGQDPEGQASPFKPPKSPGGES